MPGKGKGGNSPYSVLIFKGGYDTPIRHFYHDPIDALTAAITFLREGYQARLSDGCVEWFRTHPVPQLDAVTGNGAAELHPATAPPATFKASRA